MSRIWGIEMTKAALEWIVGDDTGLSSKALWAKMMGVEPRHYYNYPHDGGDFGRCDRLLNAVPEWRARLPEMAACSPQWAALVERWEEIRVAYRHDEKLGGGAHYSKYRTYPLMRSILAPLERPTP